MVAVYWAILPESPPLDVEELYRAGSSYAGLDVVSQTPLTGKTVVITGSTSGIGKAAVHYCCQLGATVIAMGRNPQKLLQLQQEHADCSIKSIKADHVDLESVARAAKQILKSYPSGIDVLVNNAGIHAKFEGMWHHQITPQGFDLTFGVNYLSHFLLTERLLPLLQRVSGRVVQVSSLYHATVNGEDVSPSTTDMVAAKQGGATAEYLWRTSRSYSNSKLAQILHARWMNRHVENITAVSVCPAWVATNISGTHETWLLHDGFETFAFDANEHGVSSVMRAIVGANATAATDGGNDFYINTHLADPLLRHPWFRNLQPSPMLLDIFGSVFAAYLFFGQRWAPIRNVGLSSPPSYNTTLQDELVAWSREAVKHIP
jgi:NAD(P)-dependent dehydrogenase (short-subunit alcohol dehydrogenase family)